MGRRKKSGNALPLLILILMFTLLLITWPDKISDNRVRNKVQKLEQRITDIENQIKPHK